MSKIPVKKIAYGDSFCFINECDFDSSVHKEFVEEVKKEVPAAPKEKAPKEETPKEKEPKEEPAKPRRGRAANQ